MTARQRLGDFGERVAGHRLEASGMRILGRKVRVATGEIDIVARDGEDLVFVEVRTRRAMPGSAAESIDPRKLLRMWHCALAYCDAHDADPGLVRIDVISIDINAAGKIGAIEHFRGVEIADVEGSE